MTEQQSFPSEGEEKLPDECAWCGKPRAGFITIQPDRFGFTKPDENGKKIRYLRKRSIRASACAYHLKNLKLWGTD